MRKKLTIILFSLVVFGSCRKDQSFDKQDAGINIHADSLTVSDVRSWMAAQHSGSRLRTAAITGKFDLESIASGQRNSGGNYLFADFTGSPTFQQVKQGFRKMLFTKVKGGINAYILEVVPDVLACQRSGTITSSTFTGRVFVYADNYRLIGGFVYIDGKRAGTIKPESAGTTSGEKSLKVASVPAGGGGSSSCEWVQSSYTNSDGELVIYAEKVCTIDPTDLSQDMPSDLPPIDQNPPEYTQGGGGSGSAPAVSNLPGENNPKINPKSYTNCFSNIPDAGATMKITVYVQEPWPGTTFNLGSNSVGHVAIGLTKTNGLQTITQVVGFYPNATGASKVHAPSKLVDNGGFDYNASITFSVSAQNFNAILKYVGSPPATYDLTDFNCTNFAISACQKAGITLPDASNTVGLSGPGGAMTAMTPAGLGNSIEHMNSNSVNKNGGTMPASKGACN